MVEHRFWLLGAFETGKDVTSRSSDHGFLFKFHRHLSYIFNRFNAISAFSVVNYGGISIFTAGGSFRQGMMLPCDPLTLNLYKWSFAIFRKSLTAKIITLGCCYPSMLQTSVCQLTVWNALDALSLAVSFRFLCDNVFDSPCWKIQRLV